MHARASFGQWGENEACSYLKTRGYDIIDRNYRCKFGEIDIVGCKNCELVFVEVKSRRSYKYGTPAEAVTKVKQTKIHKTALDFLSKFGKYYEKFRFDVIEIIIQNGNVIINHIPNSF